MPFRIPKWKYLKYDIQERLENLVLRRWINSSPRIIIVITNLSVIILILVIIGMYKHNDVMKINSPSKQWFYDLNTGQLFVAPKNAVPPIAAPSGPLADGRAAGVKAYVFSYVQEPNESERFIGFLETTDANYVGRNDTPKKWGQGMLIKRLSDTKWFPAGSRQGRGIFQQAFTPNEYGENPYYCSPK